MATTSPSAADGRSEELRLALVLNGGVSLAVWMGGVAFELNRLVRETHPVYRGLLQLTATAARIDVISGTSAGGINGAALALAQVHDRGLGSLRDVWLGTASLERLLRDPDDAELNSLLRGNEWFLPQIRSTLADLAHGEPVPKAAAPVLLSLTSTLLDGIGSKRLDDFGTVVEDTVHKAIWRFGRTEDGDDAFGHAQIVDQLAAAARATASFPVAFEPARFEPGAAAFANAQPLKSRQAPDRAIDKEVFLLDGGILDNQPFDAALEGIARLPALGNTRRVLAYVVPDPPAEPQPRKKGLDGKLVAPTLAEVTWRSLIDIPMSQSIASHMARLRAHNSDTGRRWQRLVGAVREVGAGGLLRSAATMLPAYRARRLDGIIDYFLEQIAIGLATPAPGEREIGMRRATRQWLRTTWRRMSDVEPALWATAVPATFQPATQLVSGAAPRWPWGLYALQFVAEFTIEVLRRTQRLRGLLTRWHESSGAEVESAPWPEPSPADADASHWDRIDCSASAVGRALRSGQARIGDAGTAPLWQDAYRRARALRTRRDHSSIDIAKAGREGFTRLVDSWTEQGCQAPPDGPARELLDRLRAGIAESEATNAAEAAALCGLLVRLRPLIDEILDAHSRVDVVRADVDEAVHEMRRIRAYLYEALPDDAGDELDRIAWRVLALEVFEVCAGSRSRAPDAMAEVVQISARQGSAWGGSKDPQDKVNGIQLGHFGAFYKRSWRANDWTYGRLDGIDRAVRIALNPDALQRRYGLRSVRLGDQMVGASEYVMRYLHALAVDSAAPELQPLLAQHWDEAAIRKELQWLDQHSTLPPPVLEQCALALTRRLQLEALRRELPEIAKCLVAERDGGAPPSASNGVPLLARVAPDGHAVTPTPDDVVLLVQHNLLGGETLAQQAGSDLFTRTTSQALVTAHGALASQRSGFNAINVLLKLSEWPLRIVYWMANRLAGSGSGAAIEGAVIGAGAVLVAASLVTPKLPDTLLALGWALVAAAIGITLLRRLSLGVVFLLLVVALVWVVEQQVLWWQAAAAAGVAFVLLQPWSTVPPAILVVLMAAFWSTHASFDALRALLCDWHLWNGTCAAPDEKLLPDIARLKRVLPSALVICALVIVSAASRRVAGLARRSSMGAVRKAAQGLRAMRRGGHPRG
ncbi:MAG TPA: patatin-like protein [Burkholderiaceae bacterium]|nr:patatin-like protein [Burkholderiaceae bacterium]